MGRKRVQDDSCRDRVLENILLFARRELEFRAYYKAIRHGDVGAMELLLQLWGPQFLCGSGNKYGAEILDIRCGMLSEWSKELKQVVRRNWVINPRGRSGKCLALDEFMEELVRALKQQYNPGNSENLDDFQRKVVARCAVYFMSVKEDVREGLEIRKHSGDCVKRQSTADILTLVEKLLEEKVVKEIEGRGSTEEDEVHVVPDLMSGGLERLVDGKFWPTFLSRSLGCSRLRRLQLVGMVDESMDSDEDNDMESDN